MARSRKRPPFTARPASNPARGLLRVDLIDRLQADLTDTPTTTKGSMGQEVAHPILSELRQHRGPQRPSSGRWRWPTPTLRPQMPARLPVREPRPSPVPAGPGIRRSGESAPLNPGRLEWDEDGLPVAGQRTKDVAPAGRQVLMWSETVLTQPDGDGGPASRGAGGITGPFCRLVVRPGRGR